MNTVTDGCCVIDALRGIDTASPQISQFTDNFTKIKFVIGKNLEDYTVMILTDICGKVEFVVPDNDVLIKTTDPENNETTLLWNIGREITDQSGIVTYQLVAYKGTSDNIESTWYSCEGRLRVTDSIDSTTHSASVLGTHPNLVTKLILEIEKNKENTNSLNDSKVDKVAGFGLTEENFSPAFKEKLEGIEEGAEKNVCSDWNEADSSKDTYIKNKPSNFGSVRIVNEEMTNFEFKGDDMPIGFVQGTGIDFSVENGPDNRYVEISAIVDKTYNSKSDFAQSGKAVAQAISDLIDSAPAALDTLKEISEALNNDPDFGNTIMAELLKKADASTLSQVAKTGHYDHLIGIPLIHNDYDPNTVNAISGMGVKKALDTLSKAAKSGLYSDLDNIPVKFIDVDIFEEEINNLEDAGIYAVKESVMSLSENSNLSQYYYVFITVSESEGNEFVPPANTKFFKNRKCSQFIISPDSLKIRCKTDKIYYDDQRVIPGEWEDGTIGGVSKEYVDNAIGDIETSLENIIAKYGLGGDCV